MISKKLAKLILNESLKTGADFSELYCEKTFSKGFLYENGKVECTSNNSMCGIGLRIIKDNQSVYGSTNELNKNALLKLAKNLTAAFNGDRIKEVKEFSTKRIKKISKITNSYFDSPMEEKIEIAKLAHETMKNYSPLIKRTIISMAGTRKKIEVFNSNGLHFKDDKERERIAFEAFAIKEDKNEIAFEGPGATDGMNFLRSLDIKKIATEVADDAVKSLEAKECPSGKMTVIIGNGFGGVLFHEACGHSLEASAVSKNLSVFSNRLGEQIASPLVTAYDDATIPNAWGSNNIDDEGNPTSRTCLIKNGILMNYLIDDFNGRRMNKKGNGACRRQNYKFEPTSRMSNTYIDNGTSTVEEIIKNTKLGLYAKKLSGGSVDPVTGEFEFNVSVGYIVRDGKIMERVRGATLIGKGEEVLKNIDMVGNDLLRAQGICGASSGHIATDVGQPTIRVKEILVGGNGEKLI